MDLARAHGEVDAIVGEHLTEALGQTPHLQPG